MKWNKWKRHIGKKEKSLVFFTDLDDKNKSAKLLIQYLPVNILQTQTLT